MTDEELLALDTWRSIGQVIMRLTEYQLSLLIQIEIVTKKRMTMLKRLHARYTVVRAKRELNELIGEMK